MICLVWLCIQRSIQRFQCLDVGRVKHDTDSGTEGLGREVLLEVGTDNSRVAVSLGDLSPDNTDLGTTNLLLGSVDKGNTLTKVELSILEALDTLNLDQGARGVDTALGALVRHVLAVDVKSVWGRDTRHY